MKFFNNKKNQNFLFDVLILVFIALLTRIMKPDLAFGLLFIVMPFYLILTKRKDYLIVYALAIVQAAIWIFFGNNQYGYNQDVIVIMGINIYPFLMWSVGLLLMYIYAEYLFYVFDVKKFWKQFLVYTLFFWFALVIFETLAYHVFFIRNIATSAYAGLPVCDCIHAPLWMQIVYLSMGPVNFLIQRYFKKLHLKKSVNIKKNNS